MNAGPQVVRLLVPLSPPHLVTLSQTPPPRRSHPTGRGLFFAFNCWIVLYHRWLLMAIALQLDSSLGLALGNTPLQRLP